jgi:hypothetical protein
MDEPGLDTPTIDPIDLIWLGPGFYKIAKGLGQAALKGVIPRLVTSFGEGTVGAAQVRILQSGGNTIRSSTAKALNKFFDMDLAPREWGRAVEELKDFHGLASDFHGKIDAIGNYLDKAGKIIGNISEFIQ